MLADMGRETVYPFDKCTLPAASRQEEQSMPTSEMAAVNIRLNPLGAVVLGMIVVCLGLYAFDVPNRLSSSAMKEEVSMRNILSVAIDLAQKGGDQVRQVRQGDEASFGQKEKGETKEGAKEYLTQGDLRSHRSMYYGFKKAFPSLKVCIFSRHARQLIGHPSTATGGAPACGCKHWQSPMMTSSNGNIFRDTGPLWGEPPVTGGFPSQRPVTQSFDVFFDLRLNKRSSKQSRCWWFRHHMSCSLWCHFNACWFFGKIAYFDLATTKQLITISLQTFVQGICKPASFLHWSWRALDSQADSRSIELFSFQSWKSGHYQQATYHLCPSHVHTCSCIPVHTRVLVVVSLKFRIPSNL